MIELTTKERYINLFTDFGFKKIFGEAINKDLLLDFLNELLREEQGVIASITYLKNEHLGSTKEDRRTIFDLYCENERGETFIVEIQKAKQKYFKDRTLFYSTFPIREQAQRGEWDYKLKAVYTIAILDFEFDEDKLDADPDKVKYTVKLSDIETNKVFYDKLTFIYLTMPKFRKTADELETHFDKWLYIIRNLERLEKIPDAMKEQLFIKLFQSAEIAKFSPTELKAYEESLTAYRDLKNSLDTAEEKGVEKGIKIGEDKAKKDMAHRLLAKGYSALEISELTGLSKSEISQLG